MSGQGLSVLDRLTSECPGSERARRAEPGPVGLRDSLRRDLEWLLNSRRRVGIPSDPGALGRSVVGYGFPDLAQFYPLAARDREALQEAMASAVQAFEPRLRLVRVTLEPTSDLQPSLHFRLEAELAHEAPGEAVCFAGRLHLGSGAFRVEEP